MVKMVKMTVLIRRVYSGEKVKDQDVDYGFQRLTISVEQILTSHQRQTHHRKVMTHYTHSIVCQW